MNLPEDKDEISVIGISLGLTAISASVIFGTETSTFILLICLIIYILGGFASSFLYYTFLVNKIPNTMEEWNKKGGMNFKGIFWIFKHYLKLFTRQIFTLKGNRLIQIRELGYLTILVILWILWISFTIPIVKIIGVKLL